MDYKTSILMILTAILIFIIVFVIPIIITSKLNDIIILLRDIQKNTNNDKTKNQGE